MQMREKVGKSRNTVFFEWFGAPEGRKVGSLKRPVRSHLGRWEMKSCTPLWREAHFQVKMYKAHHSRTTPFSDHFWKLRCRKSARRCGAKHISKSKCTKHTILGALLEVEMSKKCTPLWREAHFQVKMYKAHHSRTTFGSWDVEKVHAVVARSTFRSQNVQNTPFSDHFWKLRCRKSESRCGAKHISKSKCTKHTILGPLLEVEMSKKWKPLWREAHFEVKMYKTPGVRTTFGGSDVASCGRRKGLCTLSKVNKREGFVAFSTTTTATPHYTPIHYTTPTPSLHSTTLHSTTLHCTQLHSITLHYITLHYTPLHYITLHYITLHYITLHYLPLHYTTLHSTTLHYTTFHYTSLHYTTLHSTTTTTTQLHSTTLHHSKLHYTTLHYTTLHCTKLHYATLHYTTFHYTSLHYTSLHSTTLQLQLHSTTLNYTTLHNITLHYTTFHYTPLHYTTLHWMTLHHR